MRTRSQSRNSNRQQQQVPPTFVEPFDLEEPINNQDPPDPPVVTMADNRTMAQLLQAPTEGYEDAIVITSTMKFPNVPSTSVKLMLFPFSLEGAARIWLEKEPPRSILTWDDLVLKFINQFFPPSKTTNLRNEITNFQQRFDESFYEAWDRFNDLLRACPDQDSLNSAAGGNFLDKMPRDCLRIIESKSKVRHSRSKAIVAKVSTSNSTPGISPDVAELKDMGKGKIVDTTRAQQQVLDDELVALANRLKIGKSNLRLSSILKSKEPTLQVALDALKLTPFYNAFEISVDLNGKIHTVNVDNFRDMLKICPKLPGQIFEEPLLEEEILSFIRNLRHTGEIKFLSDVNVNHMHQPWRSFAAIINKCLSGKTTTLESLRLSRAQILWGMYHNKTIDYLYLLWDDLVYQVENKNSYIRTKTWNDFMFTTIRVISKHQDTQVYGTILPQHLTNQAMLEFEAYMTYHAYATGEKTLKPKSIKKKVDSESSPKTKLTHASKRKRINTVAKGDKYAKKKQSVTKLKGLTVLSKVTLTEVEQIKLATKRSLIQTHSSHASGSGADEGTEEDNDEVTVSKDNDDDDDDQDADATDDQDKDDQDAENPDDDNEQTDSNNNVQTPSHVESTDDEDDDEEIQGVNIEGEEMDEDSNNEESERNELYRDLNVNLEGRDVELTDAQPTNVITTQVIEDTYVIITPVIPEDQQQSSSISSVFVSNMLNPRPDTGIDSIFTLNTEATSLVDVSVTTIAAPPFMSTTTLPPPPTPLITHILKTLETDFSEFKQTNQFAKVVSSILGIVDAYLANKRNEVIKTAVQLQSNRPIDESQAKNEDFLNKHDDNIKKIIKNHVKEQVKAQVSKILPKIEKTVNEQLEAKIMTRSSTKSKTSLAIAANLSELELKKILIEKMESNKSIHRSNEQKNLYKALVEAYESDKLILDTYGDTVSFKRRRDDEDKDEEPSARSNRGSIGESAHAEEPMHTAKDLEEPTHQELPSPDHDWNKTSPTDHGPVQPWLSNLAREEGPRESFDELMDTPLDFSAFMMNRLKVDTLTPELLAGPTFELMKGTCKSLVELEYFFEEVYKATTDQLDWNNPEGQQYPHDLRKPLPLIPNSRGRQVIPFDHFINNDLAYLSGGVSSRTYATSVTKTKAADYGHIKWIEDLVPNTMWSEVPVNYDKHALWGISHWGRKRQQFYGFAANRESARDVYYKRRIIAVTKLQIVEWHGYKHLDWITVHRDDDKLYTFKEGDFKRLRLQDIEDMLILLAQGKLTNLNVEDRLAFGVSLRMFTRSIVIQRRVEDLQLGVESYQKKLNITKPDTYRSDLKCRDAYTAYSNPELSYYKQDKKKQLMRIDELPQV
ncbi:uncharacterized mitochondrial protein-like protein [Tanacetum coccineum]